MFTLTADDCVWLLTHLLRQDSRNIRSLATFGYFKKNTLRKIRLDLCCVFCMLCLSLVSGYLMMFCSGRWWPRLPKILMFCAKILSCHLMIRITLIFAHKLLCKHDCHILDRKNWGKDTGYCNSAVVIRWLFSNHGMMRENEISS